MSLQNRIETLRNTKNSNSNGYFEYKTSIQQIESFLDDKVVNMYNRPWQKLENSLKLNKIKEYLSNQELDDEEYNLELNRLSKAIKMKTLKTAHVSYNFDECIIENINFKS
tara:strand:+ start:235 stop:567 length:333 start_codon:yes stop_codon:yes gene_type:complete